VVSHCVSVDVRIVAKNVTGMPHVACVYSFSPMPSGAHVLNEGLMLLVPRLLFLELPIHLLYLAI